MRGGVDVEGDNWTRRVGEMHSAWRLRTMLIIDDTQWQLITLDEEQYMTFSNEYLPCESWAPPALVPRPIMRFVCS
jgi:hypothetical protein